MDEGGPAQAEPEAGDLKNEDPEFVGVVKDTGSRMN